MQVYVRNVTTQIHSYDNVLHCSCRHLVTRSRHLWKDTTRIGLLKIVQRTVSPDCCQGSRFCAFFTSIRFLSFFRTIDLALPFTVSSYLPSLEHWLSILSLLRPVDSPTADNTNQNDNPTILSELPSIIVLHEPSQCFQTESNSNTAMWVYLARTERRSNQLRKDILHLF